MNISQKCTQRTRQLLFVSSLYSFLLFVADFSRILPRDDKIHTVNLTPSNYNANFEFLMPKLSRNLIPFEKLIERKLPGDGIKPRKTDSIDYENIEKYKEFNSKYKK